MNKILNEFMDNQSDFNGLPPWIQANLRKSKEQALVQDLQHFLRLLEQFMTKHHIKSLEDMRESHCLEFLTELRHHGAHPIVEVEARTVEDQS